MLDCLFLTTHTSHFGLLDALGAILQLGAAKTYLFGFAHHVAHEEWEALGRELDGTRLAGDEDAFVAKAMAIGGDVAEQVREKRAFVRPAFDGLRLVCRRAEADGPSTVDDGEPPAEVRSRRGRSDGRADRRALLLGLRRLRNGVPLPPAARPRLPHLLYRSFVTLALRRLFPL
jgi:hypothetical protein